MVSNIFRFVNRANSKAMHMYPKENIDYPAKSLIFFMKRKNTLSQQYSLSFPV